MAEVQLFRQAEPVGEFGRRRVVEGVTVRRAHHRAVARFDPAVVGEPLGPGRPGSEHLDRIAVARQEPVHPDQVAVVPSTEQRHPRFGVDDEGGPPQDEGAHDDLADVLLRARHPAGLVPGQANDAAFLAGPSSDQDLALVEQVRLARELVLGGGRDDGGLAAVVQVVDLDVAVQDREELDAALPALERHRALLQPLDLAICRQARDLILVQDRERLPLAPLRVARVDRPAGRFDRRLDAHASLLRCSTAGRENR
ncbi:MAG: hypothetical protein KDG89_14835 [Geminicoccaceae bacterium]|nr:hypothetical protein [Geminicoccaceae bacterium]